MDKEKRICFVFRESFLELASEVAYEKKLPRNDFLKQAIYQAVGFEENFQKNKQKNSENVAKTQVKP